MTTKDLLRRQMLLTRAMTEQVSDDLTENHLAVKPEDFGNPGLWILGHIAVIRGQYLYYARGDRSRLPAGWSELFGTGSVLRVDLAIYPKAADIRRVMKREYEDALAFLDTLTPDDLEKPPVIATPNYLTITDVFLATAVHEAYHAGQFGLIRRLSGLNTFG